MHTISTTLLNIHNARIKLPPSKTAKPECVSMSLMPTCSVLECKENEADNTEQLALTCEMYNNNLSATPACK